MSEIDLLDRQLIENIVFNGFQAKVSGIRKFASGFVNRNYEVELEDSTFQRFVVRIYQVVGRRSRSYTEKRILQYLDCARLLPAPLAVDPPFSLENDGSKEYLVLTRLPGTNLGELLPTLNHDEQFQVGFQVGTFLRRLHSIVYDYFGELSEHSLLRFASERDWVYSRAENLLDQCEKHGIMSVKEMRWLQSQFRQAESFLDQKQGVLTHGDLNSGNIIVDRVDEQYRVTGFVDFENSTVGSAEMDFIPLQLQHQESPRLYEGVRSGYQLSLDDEYFKQRLELFELLLDLQVLVDVAHALTGPVIRGSTDTPNLPIQHIKRIHNKLKVKCS
ncbi:MAG: aminoglycoside phosphotransferase family protein [Anaerolineae bacterium]